MFVSALFIIAAYLVGSVSTAIIVCNVLGVADPRAVGSHNPGATNVLRHAGKAAAAATLLGDAGKGVLPVLVGHAYGFNESQLAAIGLAAFLGHLYPIYYGFAGGKGVATFIGVNLALQLWLGLAFIGTWLAVALVLRYSSLAALVATAVTPAVALWLGQPLAAVFMITVMSAFVYWRHRSNIQNLWAGAEKKIGRKS